MRAGIADQERVAVGRRLGHTLAAGHAGGGADILHHDRLPEQFAHALRLDAGADVDAAAGGEGNDQRDRPRGPILRGDRRGQRDHGRRGGQLGLVHAVLLVARTLAPIAGAIKVFFVAPGHPPG